VPFSASISVSRFDFAQQRAHRLRVEREEVLELEHLALDLPRQRLVELGDLGHDALFQHLAGVVDDVRHLARAAHGERLAAVGLADPAGEQFFQHGQRLGRYRAQRGDAVDDLGLDIGRQRMQHGGGYFGVKLDQQHGDRLRMFARYQRDQRLRVEPAGQFQRRWLRLVRGDALHHVFGLHLAHGAGHQAADMPQPVMRDEAELFGAIDETGDGLGDGPGADLAQRAHLLAQQAQFVGLKLGQDARGLGLVHQHDHHRGAVWLGHGGGVWQGGYLAHRAACSCAFSIWRSAISASCGRSSTMR